MDTVEMPNFGPIPLKIQAICTFFLVIVTRQATVEMILQLEYHRC